MYTTVGTLKYGPGLMASVLIDKEMPKYYRSFIPRYYSLQGISYAPHVTVVRLDIEQPNTVNWAKYEGEQIVIDYENIIRHDDKHWWIDVYSERIGEIRQELGLGKFREGYRRYHLTIAYQTK